MADTSLMPDPVTRSKTPDYGYIREFDGDRYPSAEPPRTSTAKPGDGVYVREFDGSSSFTKDGYIRELSPPTQKSADEQLERALIDAIRHGVGR